MTQRFVKNISCLHETPPLTRLFAHFSCPSSIGVSTMDSIHNATTKQHRVIRQQPQLEQWPNGYDSQTFNFFIHIMIRVHGRNPCRRMPVWRIAGQQFFLTCLVCAGPIVMSVEEREWLNMYPVCGSFRGFPVGACFIKGTNSNPT